MTLTYVHPPVDTYRNMASEYYVDVLEESDIVIKKIETVGEATEVYRKAFREKFNSRMVRAKPRVSCLESPVVRRNRPVRLDTLPDVAPPTMRS
jgi:hypothetical protein